MILFLDGGYILADRCAACVENIREYAQREELISVKIEDNMDWNRVCRYLEDAHAIVLAADVYLDSVSSTVLRFLERVEQAVIDGESIGGRFYAVLYTELYEGEQTSVAMEILKNFCVHANIAWGRGLGIGGSNVGTTVCKKSLWNVFRKGAEDFRASALQSQALFIRERIQGTDVYINPKEVSRRGYIRKMNQKMKKSNRVKIAQNL
ncbi:MAG: hypothetical protein K2G55_20605 [Lachnospiraceae bacterium]|nr:hypothetical protein [Lachnospiraceae bacterium]MDE7203385.1 hypothetical protein [Lachnospiraceae bacterium]